MGRDSQLAVDLRMYAWMPPGEHTPRLLISNPASAWGRAGLHTGDRITEINGVPIASIADFRAVLVRLRLGDTVTVVVNRPNGPYRATVVASGYDRPTGRIEDIPEATERQRALRRGGSRENREVLLLPHQEAAWARISAIRSITSSTAQRRSPSTT